MKDEVIELINNICGKEINRVYKYLYGECMNATINDKRDHLKAYYIMYTDLSNLKEEFIIKQHIIECWTNGMQHKYKKQRGDRW